MHSTSSSWTALAAALLDREVARSVGGDPVSGMTLLPAVAAGPGLAAGAAAEPGPPKRGPELPGSGGPELLDAAERAVDAAQAELTAVLDGLDGTFRDPSGAEADGPSHPLARIAAAAELDPTDTQVLAVCAAIELDRNLQRLVAMLRANPAATRPDVDLIGRMLGPSAVAALAGDGQLARAALLDMDPTEAFAAATLTVPRQVCWALIGDHTLDPGLPPGTELIETESLTLGGPTMVLVTGVDKVRRVQAAVAVLGCFGFLLCPMPTSDAEWRALVRQATTSGLGVILDCALPPDAVARRWMERADHLAFALCTREPLPMENVPAREFGEIAAAAPEVALSEWFSVFPDDDPPARRPTARELQWAAHARRPGQEASAVIHRVASGSLLRHATRVSPAVTWDDLVLPPDQHQQLRALAARYRDRETVHGQWGLPLYPSPGVVALFSGPSGTGKSTAAEVIAGSLGLDMFRVDLSALVSKYIGETEKNLEEIFAAARSGDYVLLFDEADALFGARSKVSDARDRYANMEVSYLLQRLESYDGFVILTSNFQGNIDAAFLRRIHVAVPFTVPTESDRARIWQRSLAGAPQQDLDLASIAKRFDLTGGSIRMAALSAAYLAASRGTPIGMAELQEAIGAEMTKLRRRATG